MPRLILLNGPPGVGKSTVAKRYVGEHPGVLLADIDVLRTSIGGWRDDFETAGQLTRPIAHAMIGTHLSGGNDVVMPQFLSDADEVAEFHHVAERAGARFIEVALMADVDVVVRRFRRRRAASSDPLSDAIGAFVDENGGESYLRQLYEELLTSLVARTEATSVQSVIDNEAATYRAVVRAIGDSSI